MKPYIFVVISTELFDLKGVRTILSIASRRWTHAFLVAFIGLLPAACRDTPSGDPLAKVGESYLTSQALDSRIPVQMAGRLHPSDRRRLVDAWVDEQLLYEEAVRLKLDEDVALQQQIEQARRDLLTAELLERTYLKNADLTEETIQQHYLEHQDDFVRDRPSLRVRHILVASRSDLGRVRKRLESGELFDQVAREESIDESAERGGDLGYFSEDRVDPAFWSTCAEAKVGRPVQARTHLGHHLIEVLDRREAGIVRDLLEVRGEIRQRILSSRRERAKQDLLDAIRNRVPVTVFEDALTPDES